MYQTLNTFINVIEILYGKKFKIRKHTGEIDGFSLLYSDLKMNNHNNLKFFNF